MTDHTTHAQSPKLCKCGCGQPVRQARFPSWQPVFIKGHNPRQSLLKRFYKYVAPGSADQCWPWKGKTRNGYGRLNIDGRSVYAHRISYEIYIGPIPDGLWVLHKCDNPRCCNWNHFFLGTEADNVHDMLAKGRGGYTGSPGESHPSAKLSADNVLQIRALWKQGVSQSEIGRRFSMTQSQIWRIVHRKSWTHIP